MSEVRFRPATPADDPFFREMEFATTWESLSPEERARFTPEAIREALDVTHRLLLARPGQRIVIAETEDGRRVGLLWLGVNRNLVTGEEEAWVYNVSVVPEFRGRGLGRRLMEHAEALARSSGYRILGLMVSVHNEPALRLYESLSFAPTNLIMRKQLAG